MNVKDIHIVDAFVNTCLICLTVHRKRKHGGVLSIGPDAGHDTASGCASVSTEVLN